MVSNNQVKDNILLLIKKTKYGVECLKALSHETRLLTICYLSNGEKKVQELEKFLGISQSNISQHLAKLRDKGILDTRKAGNQVFYRIKNPDILLDVIEAIGKAIGKEALRKQ